MIGFALIRPAFLTFFYQRSSFALSTTIRSRNEAMAKPLKPVTLWLVPSFLQHNLHLVVSVSYLHISVMKFQDKFASLRQVNSPYSWDKFQICCTDKYLIRLLPNFAVFFVFLWISRDFADVPDFRSSATAQNIRSPVPVIVTAKTRNISEEYSYRALRKARQDKTTHAEQKIFNKINRVRLF